jgi:hypothetical protein
MFRISAASYSKHVGAKSGRLLDARKAEGGGRFWFSGRVGDK